MQCQTGSGTIEAFGQEKGMMCRIRGRVIREKLAGQGGPTRHTTRISRVMS